MYLTRVFIAAICLVPLYKAEAATPSGNCPDHTPGTSIFFVNGIMNHTTDAVQSLNTLRSQVVARLQADNARQSECIKFILALNPTGGLLRDLWVSAKQSLGWDITELMRVLSGNENASVGFQAVLKTVNWSKTDSNVRDIHRAAYQAAIQGGNTVIAVAHSQGNFYANDSYLDLLSRGTSLPDPKVFNIVSVATPAPETEGGGLYTTLCSDFISLVPNALPWNVTNDSSICNSVLPLQLLSQHNFVQYYLAPGSRSQSKIMGEIEALIPFRQPSFGNVVVKATLDGQPWPTSGSAGLQYQVTGPQVVFIGQFVPRFDVGTTVGQYTLLKNSVVGGPAGSVLSSITPAESQFVSSGNTTSFVINFKTPGQPSAGFTMSYGAQLATEGQSLTVSAGSGNTVAIVLNASRSAASAGSIVAWTWKIDGQPVSTANNFSTILGIGSHTISLVVTDNVGVQSQASIGTIVVTEIAVVPAMKTARRLHAATVLTNGTVLITGGETPGSGPTGLAEIYNPETNTWRYTTSSMNMVRSYHSATRLGDGRVLVVSDGTAEIFDPSTEAFTLVAPPKRRHSNHRAVALNDGRIMIIGGFGEPREELVEVFTQTSPTSGTWSFTATAPLEVGPDLAATRLLDGRVLVTGCNLCSNPTGVQVYQPTTDSWQILAPMLYPRSTHTLTTLPNGKVLIAGGNDGSTPSSVAELYDVSVGIIGQSSPIGTVTVGGWRNTATGLPNGDVLLAGGYNYPIAPDGSACCALATANTQLYHLSDGTLISTSPLMYARGGHTATLLPSGAVLLVGGFSYDYPIPRDGLTGVAILDSAELWK